MNKVNGLYRATIISCTASLGLASGQVCAENTGGWEYSVAPLYLWAKNIDGSSSLGYRYLDTDYSNGKSGPEEYSFNADQQGPILGINFYF